MKIYRLQWQDANGMAQAWAGSKRDAVDKRRAILEQYRERFARDRTDREERRKDTLPVRPPLRQRAPRSASHLHEVPTRGSGAP